MTDKAKKPSDTARTLLTSAAARDDHLVPLPKLAAARQVVRSLLKAGLVNEVTAPTDDPPCAGRTGEEGVVIMLRATAIGLAADEPAQPIDTQHVVSER